jgi:tetratricopeptide (TPR) repeat protein
LRFWIADFLFVLFLHFASLAFAQTSLQEALSAIEGGDYAAAEQALSANPEHLLLKGILQFHRGDYVSAEDILILALQTNDNSHGRVFLAMARAAIGGCETARGELEQQFNGLSTGDLHRLTGLALSQCHLAGNRYIEAQAVLARLASLYSGDADVWYQSARLHMKAWNDAVFQMFEKTPSSFRVNQLSAEVFETQGKYAEAIGEYRKAIEKNPTALNLHFRLGRALLMESHSPESLERARSEFEAELRLNPKDAAAEYQIGQILMAEQKGAEAAGHYEKALALSPQFPEALLALGKIRADERRFGESIELLRRAVELLPKSEAAHYALMIAYRNAGRSAEALQMKKVLEQLQRPPEGEFADFLRRLGENPAKSQDDRQDPKAPR